MFRMEVVRKNDSRLSLRGGVKMSQGGVNVHEVNLTNIEKLDETVNGTFWPILVNTRKMFMDSF